MDFHAISWREFALKRFHPRDIIIYNIKWQHVDASSLGWSDPSNWSNTHVPPTGADIHFGHADSLPRPRKSLSDHASTTQQFAYNESRYTYVFTYYTNSLNFLYLHKHIIGWFVSVPEEAGQENTGAQYEELIRSAATRTHALRQQLAAELAPAINARIRQPDMPHDTLEQKKMLAAWVNDQLEPLGLAVQCPNTGLPAKLRGITGNWPGGTGAFCFEIYEDSKRRKSASSMTLPVLKLMDASPETQMETVWQKRVGPKASRRGHEIE